MKEDNISTRAFLLNSVNYGDNHKIINLLTWKDGVRSAIALGARQSRKRFAGCFEPFNLLNVELASRSKSNLVRLHNANYVWINKKIRSHINRIAVAAYLTEITKEFTHESLPCQDIFTSLFAAYILLENGFKIESILAFSMVSLLIHSGVSPNMDICLSCKTPVNCGHTYYLQPSSGGILCRWCEPSPSASKYTLPGDLLLAINKSISFCFDIQSLNLFEQSDRDRLGQFWTKAIEFLENCWQDNQNIFFPFLYTFNQYITYTIEKEVKNFKFLISVL